MHYWEYKGIGKSAGWEDELIINQTGLLYDLLRYLGDEVSRDIKR